MPPCALLCPFVPFLSRRGPQLGGADLGDQNREQGGRRVGGADCSTAIGEDPSYLDGLGLGAGVGR